MPKPPSGNYLVGTSGNDILDRRGHTDDWKIDGRAGDDTIYGGSGHDSLFGGRGDDLTTPRQMIPSSTAGQASTP